VAFPLGAGVTLAGGRVGVLADGRVGVLAVGRAEVVEDKGATEGVTGAADVTEEELADHSSSKRPLSSSRSSCGMQEHNSVFMNASMFVTFADTCLLCKPIYCCCRPLDFVLLICGEVYE